MPKGSGKKKKGEKDRFVGGASNCYEHWQRVYGNEIASSAMQKSDFISTTAPSLGRMQQH